jgi:hypothetical protein
MGASDFKLSIVPDGDLFRVQVNGPDISVEEAFQLDRSEIEEFVQRVSASKCAESDVQYVGKKLYDALIIGNLHEAFKKSNTPANEDLVRLRLRIAEPLADLPWEALYTKSFGFLSGNDRFCILHDPPDDIDLPPRPDIPIDRVRMLVVIPTGSGLNDKSEWKVLETAVARLKEQGKLDVVRLNGRVTAERLREKLLEGNWHIVHFVGHGRRTVIEGAEPTTEIRLSADEDEGPDDESEGKWVTADTFASNFRGCNVRLVVLNSCEGGQGGNTMNGASAPLLRVSVPAVVAMRYEVLDRLAIKFSQGFYGALLSDATAGRVDLAMERARALMRNSQSIENAQGFVTPVLQVAPGCEWLFKLKEASPRSQFIPAPAEPKRLVFDQVLVTRIAKGNCGVVVGPGLLQVQSRRVLNGPPDLRRLATILAPGCSYGPLDAEESTSSVGEWLAGILLQRICQRYRMQETRSELIASIRDVYVKQPPPDDLRKIAAWRPPVLFSLTVDGLLEVAFAETQQHVRIVNQLEEDVDLAPGTPLLVNVCGSISDEESLVLSEDDYDQLWDRLAAGKIAAQIGAGIKGYLDRSALILGASPRDPLLRRLAQRLLDTSAKRRHGKVFFACEDFTRSDEAYWAKYNTVWLHANTSEVIQSLDLQVAEVRQGMQGGKS